MGTPKKSTGADPKTQNPLVLITLLFYFLFNTHLRKAAAGLNDVNDININCRNVCTRTRTRAHTRLERINKVIRWELNPIHAKPEKIMI